MRDPDEQHNAGWGGKRGLPLPLELFDLMPAEIKRVYQFAAYDYTPISAWTRWKRGWSVDQIVTSTKIRMRHRLRAEVLRVYGPTHPQAQP